MEPYLCLKSGDCLIWDHMISETANQAENNSEILATIIYVETPHSDCRQSIFWVKLLKGCKNAIVDKEGIIHL